MTERPIIRDGVCDRPDLLKSELARPDAVIEYTGDIRGASKLIGMHSHWWDGEENLSHKHSIIHPDGRVWVL